MIIKFNPNYLLNLGNSKAWSSLGVNFRAFAFPHSLTHGAEPFFEKLPIVQPLKKFPAFYGTRRFITMFTRALH
jgi:hypothetical protein